MFGLIFFHKETSEAQCVGGTTECIYIHALFLYPTYRIKRGRLTLGNLVSTVPSVSSHSWKQISALHLQMVAVVDV